jgi:signal peptidase II
MMNRRKWIYLLIMGLTIGLDQWSKILAVDHLKGRPGFDLLAGFVRMDYAENPGAFLSLGANLSDETRFWVLTIAVAVVLFWCLGLLFVSKQFDRSGGLTLSFIIGGGLSNLIDRAFRDGGRVVDYVQVGFDFAKTGIFNIADMAITFGVIWMFVESIRESRRAATKDSKQS